MFHSYIRKYLLAGLAATPDVLDALLKDVADGSPAWDVRPDPERFTIREILGHLADWEPIWQARLIRIRDEEAPELPNVDEGQIAIDHHYAAQDCRANLLSFRKERKLLLHLLESLPDSAWDRIGLRTPGVGAVSLEAMAVMVLGHDGYHAHQIIQWLDAASEA